MRIQVLPSARLSPLLRVVIDGVDGDQHSLNPDDIIMSHRGYPIDPIQAADILSSPDGYVDLTTSVQFTPTEPEHPWQDEPEPGPYQRSTMRIFGRSVARIMFVWDELAEDDE